MATGGPGSWPGFSEEELNRIRRQGGIIFEQNGPTTEDKSVAKVASLKRNRNKKRQTQRLKPTIVTANGSSVDPNQLLGPIVVVDPNTSTDSTHSSHHHHHQHHPSSQSTTTTSSRVKTSSQIASSPVCLRITEDGQVLEVMENNFAENNNNNNDAQQQTIESNEEKVHSSQVNFVEKGITVNDLTTLEKFEQRQKMMEEQNRHRRALLSKALVERRKKTQAETEKLGQIQQALAKLDSLVSGDVAILRKQIEHASVEFNEAQKRYKKAEEEFVEAKLELFKRMEKKEQLTEHLCTIIEHNESRKAQKLAELMQELEMETFMEECQEEGFGPVLSQLCALNDIAYNSCSTIKDPNAHSSKSLPTTPDDKLSSAILHFHDDVVANDVTTGEPEEVVSSTSTSKADESIDTLNGCTNTSTPDVEGAVERETAGNSLPDEEVDQK